MSWSPWSCPSSKDMAGKTRGLRLLGKFLEALWEVASLERTTACWALVFRYMTAWVMSENIHMSHSTLQEGSRSIAAQGICRAAADIWVTCVGGRFHCRSWECGSVVKHLPGVQAIQGSASKYFSKKKTVQGFGLRATPLWGSEDASNEYWRCGWSPKWTCIDGDQCLRNIGIGKAFLWSMWMLKACAKSKDPSFPLPVFTVWDCWPPPRLANS